MRKLGPHATKAILDVMADGPSGWTLETSGKRLTLLFENAFLLKEISDCHLSIGMLPKKAWLDNLVQLAVTVTQVAVEAFDND